MVGFYMDNKSKSILKITIIVLIVCVIVGIGLLAINHNKKSLKLKDIQELKDFDITVISYLDLMPGANPSKEAYFTFSLNGIDQDRFLNEYEIDSIELNDNKIKNEITYEDYNGFRFYSSDYKNDNTVVVIIKNKNTNERYYKKLNVSTKTAM